MVYTSEDVAGTSPSLQVMGTVDVLCVEPNDQLVQDLLGATQAINAFIKTKLKSTAVARLTAVVFGLGRCPGGYASVCHLAISSPAGDEELEGRLKALVASFVSVWLSQHVLVCQLNDNDRYARYLILQDGSDSPQPEHVLSLPNVVIEDSHSIAGAQPHASPRQLPAEHQKNRPGIIDEVVGARHRSEVSFPQAATGSYRERLTAVIETSTTRLSSCRNDTFAVKAKAAFKPHSTATLIQAELTGSLVGPEMHLLDSFFAREERSKTLVQSAFDAVSAAGVPTQAVYLINSGTGAANTDTHLPILDVSVSPERKLFDQGGFEQAVKGKEVDLDLAVDVRTSSAVAQDHIRATEPMGLLLCYTVEARQQIAGVDTIGLLRHALHIKNCLSSNAISSRLWAGNAQQGEHRFALATRREVPSLEEFAAFALRDLNVISTSVLQKDLMQLPRQLSESLSGLIDKGQNSGWFPDPPFEDI